MFLRNTLRFFVLFLVLDVISLALLQPLLLFDFNNIFLGKDCNEFLNVEVVLDILNSASDVTLYAFLVG